MTVSTDTLNWLILREIKHLCNNPASIAQELIIRCQEAGNSILWTFKMISISKIIVIVIIYKKFAQTQAKKEILARNRMTQIWAGMEHRVKGIVW